MTATLEVNLVLDSLIKEFGESGLYFVLITSENGAVIKSYINQEFNKNSWNCLISFFDFMTLKLYKNWILF